MVTQLTPEEAADKLRHMMVDAIEKMNDEEGDRDRQYLLEDLVTRIAELATELDGYYGAIEVLDNVRVTPAYPLLPRSDFGDLKGLRLEDIR